MFLGGCKNFEEEITMLVKFRSLKTVIVIRACIFLIQEIQLVHNLQLSSPYVRIFFCTARTRSPLCGHELWQCVSGHRFF